LENLVQIQTGGPKDTKDAGGKDLAGGTCSQQRWKRETT